MGCGGEVGCCGGEVVCGGEVERGGEVEPVSEMNRIHKFSDNLFSSMPRIGCLCNRSCIRDTWCFCLHMILLLLNADVEVLVMVMGSVSLVTRLLLRLLLQTCPGSC